MRYRSRGAKREQRKREHKREGRGEETVAAEEKGSETRREETQEIKERRQETAVLISEGERGSRVYITKNPTPTRPIPNPAPT